MFVRKIQGQSECQPSPSDLGWGAGKREREEGIPPQRPSRVGADILD